MGKVFIHLNYYVDLDDEDMVDHAMTALYEDVMNAVKYDEVHLWIDVEEAEGISEDNIPEFLRETALMLKEERDGDAE
jgi:hypothetical protein